MLCSVTNVPTTCMNSYFPTYIHLTLNVNVNDGFKIFSDIRYSTVSLFQDLENDTGNGGNIGHCQHIVF